MESVNLKVDKKNQKIDRVVLDIKSILIIQTHSDQVRLALGDLVQISQKDIVNFLIQERSLPLTDLELTTIKNKHFDIVRALKRATLEAIKAKQDGYEIKMDEVLKIIQTPSVKMETTSLKPQGRQNKVKALPAVSKQADLNHDGINELSSSNIAYDKNKNSDSKSDEFQTVTNLIST